MTRSYERPAPPKTIRMTSRLLLRPPTASDLDFVTDMFSRAELVAHRPDPRPDSPDESAARLQRDMDHWADHGFGRWAALSGDTPVGFGGVIISKDFDGLNLSYHFHPAHWGSGYATELVTEAIRFAFEDIKTPRIVGLVRTANPASRKVLERSGFIFEREDAERSAHQSLCPHCMTAMGAFRLPVP